MSLNNYCAIDANNKRSNICKGDSGSPLMFYANRNWYIFGITSFYFYRDSDERCAFDLPSFYTIVPSFIDWINKILK